MPGVVILVAMAMVAFAANSVFARLALGAAEIDAAGYTGVRLLSGAVTLALLLVAQQRRHRPADRAGDCGRRHTCGSAHWAKTFCGSTRRSFSPMSR